MTKKYIEKPNYLGIISKIAGWFFILVYIFVIVEVISMEYLVYYIKGQLMVLLLFLGYHLAKMDFEPRKIYIKEEEIKEE